MRWLLAVGIAVVAVGALAPVVAEPGLQPVGSWFAGRTAQHPRVRPGIDVLLADSAHLVAGKRLGLITNQTGVDAAGVRTIDRLAGVSGVTLAAIFAPEHGIRGNLAPGEAVADTTDLGTGVPIYSLYGVNRAPTRNQLARLDVLIVDLQDVGARTFTYVSTTVVAMRAARAAGVRIVVLDRPNPIGCLMQGPVLDTVYATFSLGMLPVPLRHGLTIGELARFANTELGIGADLVVVPVQGWRRCDWFDRTGLPWVRPSPNLPDLAALAWYPGTVLFEATNLSVGRGTDAPFQQLGAPWLRTRPLRQMLQSAGLEAHEVRVTPAAPGDGRFDGVAVAAIRLPPLRPSDGDPIAVAVWLLDALAAQQPDSFRLDTLGLFRRLGVRIDPGHTGVCNTIDCDDWRSFRWEDQVNRFRRLVRPYMLYQR
jgi:uncharacterized protein YbbC (DUF1343 family)